MNLLLDTCSFLWFTLLDPQLSATALQAIRDPANSAYVSVVSVWEICVKYELGKLQLPDSPDQFIPAQRTGHQLLPLNLTESDVFVLGQLQPHHKDPFDRMLICQALARDLTIVTPDPLIRQYPVSVLW